MPVTFLMKLFEKIKSLFRNDHAKPALVVEARPESPRLSEDQLFALSEVLKEDWGAGCLLVYGSAGTGKSTLIRAVVEAKRGKVLVAAFTGLAADNVGGSTIHRLIRVGTNPIRFRNNAQIPLLDEDRIQVLRKAELLVIDEISMVRVDLLDALDWSLRRNLGKETKPFGGLKVLLVGDLLQLGPIAAQDDQAVLSSWDGHMFFHAKVWKEARLRAIALSTVHRQSADAEFAQMLQSLRSEDTLGEAVRWLSSNLRTTLETGEAVVLSPSKAGAENFNEQKLQALSGASQTYNAFVRGEVRESERRTLEHLKLKVGARIIVVANEPDSNPRYVNGTLGFVKKLFPDRVEIEKDKGGTVILERYVWKRYEPRVNPDTGLIEYQIAASFSQIPLKLAWAMTIHKSQGLTFEAVHIMPKPRFFASGHAYVAVSRCRKLQGLSCDRKLSEADFDWDKDLREFLAAIEKEPVWQADSSGA